MPRAVSRQVITLGIDVGSSATKAVLVDLEVGVIASASQPVELISSHPGWAEADPDVWWRNVAVLIRQLLAAAGIAPCDVSAVACSGMVPAVLCLDEHNRPLRPAILQNDARATVEIAELDSELKSVDLLHRTGSVLSQQSVGPCLLYTSPSPRDGLL